MENKFLQEGRSLFQKIQSMSVPEKIEFAHKGTKEARAILIRDPNKMVQMAVVTSPKITEGEVFALANNRNVDEEVLKYISNRREWMKNYQVKVALVNNPKTQLPQALSLVPYLVRKDLLALTKSKAIPRIISAAAQKRLQSVK
ncbi:MAG: hypothetical protein JW920_04685 [Deltaproteobacteria bacterium]|nr:hypothetical protein [Deltaproteobacteria bacterium]